MPSTKVYHGSCHCGDVKYQIRLKLPPATGPNHFTSDETRIYKCNCSTCHKLGMFHCRPIDASEDFILTSPGSVDELAKYNAFGGPVDWYSCKKCAVRTFGVGANWVQTELDVDKWAGREGGEGNVSTAWKLEALHDKLGFDGKPVNYVSVNAVTLDGLDLVELHKKGWICYYENRVRKGAEPLQTRYDEPYPGGCF